MLKPQQANQWEAGVKVDLFNGRLNLTASYYDIEVDKLVRDDQVTLNGSTYNIKSAGWEHSTAKDLKWS